MADLMKYAGISAAAIGAVTGLTAYYMTQPKPVNKIINLSQQSYHAAGEPDARLPKLCPDGKLIPYVYEDVTTVYEAFQRGARVSSNGECLGWRENGQGPYKWISYNDVLLRAANFGSGLISLGLKPVNTTNVGIYSQNKVEYILGELACYTYSMVIVPLYDTLGPDASTYIIHQAEIQAVIVDKSEKGVDLINHQAEGSTLTTVIVIEEISDELRKLAGEKGVKVLTFREVEELGVAKPHDPVPCETEHLCTICYTSGTTGKPKGAMITHRNIISVVSACLMITNPTQIVAGDSMISYLPLAHMYERAVEITMYARGGKVGMFSGDVRKLLEDIRELKPQLFPTVPRLLNRVYDQVMASVNSSILKKTIFNLAMKRKEAELRSGIIRNDSVWDKLAFRKVQQILGGKLKLITTGSAPLSEKVLNFIRCAAGCAVIEGYGQTESAAICSLGIVGDDIPGHVGPPMPCCMIKMVDVPDMGYYAKNNEGEICVKGTNVFKGYLNDPEKTAEAIDEDGWLHSGDIGRWTESGCVKIIDRKKNIFKLAQGEYIAPEKIELIYIRSPPISQVFVTGDSLQSHLVGVVVPDQEQLPKWAKTKLGINESYDQLCENEAVKKAILDDITTRGKKDGLKSFEQVKNIHIHPDQFTVENGLLTPTFKSKRNELQKFFKDHVQRMYSAASAL
ncbi:long-chain-fatty-acid--CoA ligase 1-like [Tubulanus polymorphus]|uniref:long-chain-fatty-acid--CoA ligase 1-like n=1 Tax=Tubulanus polymorphus TaxID=672921 RepID=UPI003DA513E8